MRIALIGGGVAGTVLAGELARQSDCEIVLFERNDRLGGLHHSEEFGGLQYDIGCFLFDRDHHFLQAFPALRDHFVEVDHRSRVITDAGSVDTFPMSAAGYASDRSPGALLVDILSVLASKVRCRQRDSLRSYIEYYLGPRVYRRSGLKHYIERFYGRPDTEVDLAFALQRLDGLPEAAGLRRNFSRFAGEVIRRSNAAPPWPCYVRPPQGFRYVYDLVADELRSLGVAIRLDAAIERVERDDLGRFVIHERGASLPPFDMVVSTIPSGAMARLLNRPIGRPPASIRLASLCYRFTGDLAFDDAGMFYNFTSDARWKRLTLFSTQYGRVDGDHYFTVECTLPAEDETTVEELCDDFEQHIDRLECFDGAARFEGSILTSNAYPVLTAEDIERSSRAAAAVQDYGIRLTGRQAQFIHRTSDIIAADSIRLGESIANEIGGSDGTTQIGERR